jgi:drug/metabolite transporter (DMT)-like permease
LEGYSPELIVVVRLAIAASVFRLLGGPGTRWLPRERWTLVAGLGLGGDFLVYNYGVRHTTAALASLVVNVEVVSTIALALWLLGERLSPHRIVGAAVTLLGVLYVATEGVSTTDLVAPEHVVGNLLVMLAGLLWSLFAVAQRKAPRAANRFQLLTPVFTTAMLTTLPSLAMPGAWQARPSPFSTAMLASLTVFCTIAVYVAYARSQELLDVSVLAVVLTSIPLFAIVLAYIVLGESISWRSAAGAVLVVAGVLVIASERPASTAVTAGGPD